MNFVIRIKKILKVKSENELRSKIRRILFKKKYNTNDIIETLKSIGIKEGSNVFVHSTWSEFINYTDTIDDFIKGILGLIGNSGTLAMPAFPLLRKKTSVFNVRTTPTAAGLIPERFRSYEGVKRSINLQHSVCSKGPMSEFLTSEHHHSITPWDEKSPYYRLGEIDAIILSFGLGKHFVGTILHCAESILRNDYPYFRLFFDKEVSYEYIDYEGNTHNHTYLTKSDAIIRKWTNRSHRRIIRRYFNRKKYNRKRISNLTINAYDANYAISRVIELGKKGITVYVEPDPKEYFK